MQALELETMIDPAGNVHLPEQYRSVYGQHVRLLVLLPNTDEAALPHENNIDPMQFSQTVDWPVDGLEYQRRARAEWD